MFNAPLCGLARRHPAPDTGCRHAAGAKRQKETENQERATGAGARERGRVSTEADLQGTRLGESGEGKGGEVWKHRSVLRSLPSPLLCPSMRFPINHLTFHTSVSGSYAGLGCISLLKLPHTFASSKSQFSSQSLLRSSMMREKFSSCS